MRTIRKRSACLVAGCCLAAVRLCAVDAAVIVDSGSTNTAGFRIVVERSGNAVDTQTPRQPEETREAQPRRRTLPRRLLRRFYADLEAGKPLSGLPHARCLKSASFGTTLTIELAGETTPDLSCGDHSDSRLKALVRDTSEIVKLF